MKKNLKLIVAPLFFNILMAAAAGAAEQSPPDTPPQMDNLSEGEPAVTSSKKETSQQTTQQNSQIGDQTEVRVTNEVGTYIVKPNQSVGTSLPGDAQSSSNNAVQWVIKSWGGRTNTDPTPPVTPPSLPDNPEYQTDSNAK